MPKLQEDATERFNCMPLLVLPVPLCFLRYRASASRTFSLLSRYRHHTTPKFNTNNYPSGSER